MHNAVIDQADARRHLGEDDWVLIDCRFVIREPAQGERDFERSHVRGALYAHLDRDLSGPIVPGRTGRHPLPAPDAFTDSVRQWGIGDGTQVVVYDDSSGSMAAARLWWLLRWAGHEAVAVLDGGFQRWVAAGFAVEAGPAGGHAGRSPFVPRFRAEMAVDADDVLAVLHDPDWVVLDARAADRYRGENETLDPVAGHIPGAVSAPWQDNLAADGSFRSSAELQERLERLTGGRSPSRTVLYCGSGVTAAHQALAFVQAGKGMPRLYAGSWSHWITDPARPVAR